MPSLKGFTKLTFAFFAVGTGYYDSRSRFILLKVSVVVTRLLCGRDRILLSPWRRTNVYDDAWCSYHTYRMWRKNASETCVLHRVHPSERLRKKVKIGYICHVDHKDLFRQPIRLQGFLTNKTQSNGNVYECNVIFSRRLQQVGRALQR
jgi:hypothetical protein